MGAVMGTVIVIGLFVLYGLICLLVADGVMVVVDSMERERAQRAWLKRTRQPSPRTQATLDKLRDLAKS